MSVGPGPWEAARHALERGARETSHIFTKLIDIGHRPVATDTDIFN